MSQFYRKGSDLAYFSSHWSRERKVLSELGNKLVGISAANRLKVETLFSYEPGHIKPTLSDKYSYFAFPYELDDEIRYGTHSLVDEIVGLINDKLSNTKYLASTDPSKCCVMSMKEFTIDAFWAISSGHLNTPFVVFNSDKNFFTLLDYDLPVQIVGFKNESIDEEYIGIRNEYFKSQWPSVVVKYDHYSNLDNIVDQHYSFIRKVLASDKT